MTELSKLPNMAIREELIKTINESVLTQKELAAKCIDLGENMTQPHLSEFIKGNRELSRKKLEVLAQALGKNWKLD